MHCLGTRISEFLVWQSSEMVLQCWSTSISAVYTLLEQVLWQASCMASTPLMLLSMLRTCWKSDRSWAWNAQDMQDQRLQHGCLWTNASPRVSVVVLDLRADFALACNKSLSGSGEQGKNRAARRTVQIASRSDRSSFKHTAPSSLQLPPQHHILLDALLPHTAKPEDTNIASHAVWLGTPLATSYNLPEIPGRYSSIRHSTSSKGQVQGFTWLLSSTNLPLRLFPPVDFSVTREILDQNINCKLRGITSRTFSHAMFLCMWSRCWLISFFPSPPAKAK